MALMFCLTIFTWVTEACCHIFTDEEVVLLTQLLCGDKSIDGDGEYDIDFKSCVDSDQVDLVLSVVMNRVNHPSFPDTVKEVIFQRGQFAVMPRNAAREVSETSLQVVREWCREYEKHKRVRNDHLYFSGNGIINRSRRAL